MFITLKMTVDKHFVQNEIQFKRDKQNIEFNNLSMSIKDIN